MGLGQYNSLGEYCGPHASSSVFLIPIAPLFFTSLYESFCQLTEVGFAPISMDIKFLELLYNVFFHNYRS